jgi:hypothetical protein
MRQCREVAVRWLLASLATRCNCMYYLLICMRSVRAVHLLSKLLLSVIGLVTPACECYMPACCAVASEAGHTIEGSVEAKTCRLKTAPKPEARYMPQPDMCVLC